MRIHHHASLEQALAALTSGPIDERDEPHSYRRALAKQNWLKRLFRIKDGPIHVIWRRNGETVSDMTLEEAQRQNILDQTNIQRSLAAVCASRGITVGSPREESDPTSDEIDDALRGIALATYQQMA